MLNCLKIFTVNFVFVDRTLCAVADVTPGPGYLPPGLGSDRPAYTMRPKLGSSLAPREDGPGPAAYTPRQKTVGDAPAASMKPRLKEAWSVPQGHDTPGPEYVYKQKSTGDAPAATMSGRTQDFFRPITDSPGPAYSVSWGSIGADPRKGFSLTGRGSSPTRPKSAPSLLTNPAQASRAAKLRAAQADSQEVKRNTGPGPNAYVIRNDTIGSNRFGGVSFKSRPPPKRAEALGPGPGSYYVTYGTIGTKKGPSMASRTRIGEIPPLHRTPGPGSYDPPKVIGTGPAVTMKGRPGSSIPGGVGRNGKRITTPGPSPASYRIRGGIGDNPRAGVSFKSRTRTVVRQPGEDSPGSHAYIPNEDAIRSTTKGVTIKGKPKDTQLKGMSNNSPGPLAYDAAEAFRKMNTPRGATMAGRDDVFARTGMLPIANQGPSPQEYRYKGDTIGQSGPSFSIVSRDGSFGNDPTKKTTKRASSAGSINPSPAAYNPRLPRSWTPGGFTMSSRYSDVTIE